MSVADEINAFDPNVAMSGSGPKPIGVPEGYTAQRPGLSGAAERYVGYTPPPQQTPPRYFTGEEVLPASLPVEQMAALQQAMAGAGLLKGEFRLGVWDSKSRNAFSELLGYANQTGVEWQTALSIYASTPEVGGSDTAAYLPPRFQAMAPDAVKEQIQSFAESRLDRLLSEEELNAMYAVFNKAERQEHAAVSAAQEDTFNRQTGVQVEGDLPAQVEPIAVMQSVFNKKYAKAISATESTRERDARTGGLNTVGSTVSEAIR